MSRLKIIQFQEQATLVIEDLPVKCTIHCGLEKVYSTFLGIFICVERLIHISRYN
jgi:hypothetical protein